MLSKYIRTGKKWSLKESLSVTILELKRIINKDNDPTSLSEALKICRDCWGRIAPSQSSKHERNPRYGLIGKLVLGSPDRSFCFIDIGNESFFCYKSDLLANVQDGVSVTFDAKPSFDKKKNKESWRASNIKKSG